jgi:hypothetical protein
VSDDVVNTLDEFAAPYGRKITLESVQHESGLRMLRMRIREGSRFTVMDIDEDTAMRWSSVMSKWAGNTQESGA